MDARTIAAMADRLITAEETRTPIEVLSVSHPRMTQEDGYAIQHAIIRKKIARGARVIGKKVAFTSRANQEFFGVPEPAYGQLLSSGVHAEGVPVEAATLIDPIVDCEITFIIRRRLEGPGVSVPDVLRASEGIFNTLLAADVVELLAHADRTRIRLIHGRHDLVAPIEHVRALRDRFPDLALRELRGGHHLYLMYPRLLNRLIGEVI